MSKYMQRPVKDSWIPATIAWQSNSSVFGVLVSKNDQNLLEFIATGYKVISIVLPKIASLKTARFFKFLGEHSLDGKLIDAAWNPRLLKQSGTRYRKGSKVTAYCQGVFKLPGAETLLVLVSSKNHTKPHSYLSDSLVSAAQILFEEHKKNVKAHEECLAQEKANKEKVREKLAAYPEQLAIHDKMQWFSEKTCQQPVARCHDILDQFPDAVLCHHAPSISIENLNKRALDAIIKSGLGAPRDGFFSGIQSLITESGTASLVFWSAHTGILPYPEVRWAVQRGLPTALAKPRADGIGSPRKPPAGSTQNIDAIEGFPIDSNGFDETFSDFQLDDIDYSNRVAGAKRSLSENGFEASAWFQPFHNWNEGSWGIYIDAKKLDDLALSIFEDLRKSGVGGGLQKISALLAFGLVYSHEMFHAKVEAAVSWNELGARRSQYSPYKRNIYAKLFGTDGCLEEALANWSAWSWFLKLLERGQFNLNGNAASISLVVQTTLDLSPPGYRNWRTGGEVNSWREFCYQLSAGKIAAKGNNPFLPLEGNLMAIPPYDLQNSDIPLRFVGRGNIVDRLLSHPATFNVPTRRELEKALQYFKHLLDPSGGKGSHQKWTGPDQRAFHLPKRDPVSRGVFNNFLQHIGIDKITYVLKIRPQL